MPLNLPPLASLRIFEAAARLGSYREAAAELNLTPSAISHGIETLQNWVGAPLFRREGRRLILTETAEDFLPYVSEGLSLIAVGARRVSPLEDDRRVSISAPPTLASQWLVPRLSRFQARHPEVKLLIDTSHRQVVFPLEDVDLAIRMGEGRWAGTDSTLLFREYLVPVASPAYRREIMRDGEVKWTEANIIHLRTASRDWEEWLARQSLAIESRGQFHVDMISLAMDAAAAGLGIALAREPLCRSDIDAGRVETLGFAPLPIETGYWATVPSGREPRRDVKAFLSWVVAEAAADGCPWQHETAPKSKSA
ncbi:LysR substrate-binding domain-containing protein [Chelativorans sp. M5D2P16]|uniref:LysR substrate-binding domain-containing protein n=1 Tax=Chelativorans sp. M5D2P16 TaxID=3095678 RepID=UPI002ACAD42B|nr:LysR substrate-binding domain-containing protein [Chelativorans sp. M5D2P16]MDZ5698710.1 LysR substrate-binding domain-containing protein [Chelativorans sp. M5D2P16]